jgi:hypothetical protein
MNKVKTVAISFILLITSLSVLADEELKLDIFKNAQCGCCSGWVKHMESMQFDTNVTNLDQNGLNATKEKFGIQPLYQSCHTAVFEHRYIFEGHIPAKFVQQFIDEKPDGAIGLAVPGMPVGSPGMEMGERFSPYQVLLLKEDGTHVIYASIEKPDDQY